LGPKLTGLRSRVERFFNSLHFGAHQLSHATWYDRYPEIFKGARSLLKDGEDPVVLSFGCSRGEEVASIAKYFRAKKIVGADISAHVLRAASKRGRDIPNTSFVNMARESLDKHTPFDIIFAMSVLCKKKETDNITNCSTVYPFSKFEETCGMLSSHLQSGGILVIYNSNYRFTETVVSRYFIPLELPSVSGSGFVVKFDRKGVRLENQQYDYCAFRKSGPS